MKTQKDKPEIKFLRCREKFCLGIIGIFICLLLPAEDFNPAIWKKKTTIRIDNPSKSPVNNCQLLIKINGIDAGMSSDLRDIRFVDEDGKSIIPHWAESKRPTSSTKLWIRVPAINTASKTIYLYTGNPEAHNTSNFDNVFTKNPDAPENKGLIGAWNFDEPDGDTLLDDCEQSNGILHNVKRVSNGAPWKERQDVHFEKDGCLEFNGIDSFVSFPSGILGKESSSQGPITVEFWICPTSTVSVESFLQVTPGCRPYIYGGASELQVYWGGNEYIPEKGMLKVFHPGLWHHVAIMWTVNTNGTRNTKIYINAELKLNHDSNTEVDPSVATEASILGAFENDNGDHERFFQGRLDELRIYGRCLSKEEVRAHFERRTPRVEAILTNIEKSIVLK